MYLIRLNSGEEKDYGSLDALTAGVKAGDVTPTSLIFHRRAERWLPIGSHPHFKLAQEQIQARTTSAPNRHLEPGFYQRRAAATVTPRPAPMVRPATPEPVPDLDELLSLLGPEPTGATPNQPTTPPTPDGPSAAAARESQSELSILADPTPSASETGGDGFTPEVSGNGQTGSTAEAAAISSDESDETDDAPAAETDVEDTEAGIDEPPVAPRMAASPVAPVPFCLPEPPAPKAVEPAATDTPRWAPPPPADPVEPVAPTRDEEPVLTEARAILEAPDAEEFSVRAVSAADAFDHPFAGRSAGRRLNPMLIAGAAVLLISVVLLLWQPWKSDLSASPAPPATDQTAQPTVPAPSEPVVPVTSTAATTVSAFGGRDNATTRPAEQPASPTPEVAPALASAPTIELGTAAAPLVGPTTSAGSSAPALSPVAFAANYAAAYADARAELGFRLSQSGLRGLFSSAGMTSKSAVDGMLRALNGSKDAVARYRAREATIEAAYADTLRQVGRRLNLVGDELKAFDRRTPMAETKAQGEASDLLVAQVERLYRLLRDGAGQFELAGEGIRFHETQIGRQYAVLYDWITPRLDRWSQDPAGAPAVAAALMRAAGDSRLPRDIGS